MIKIVYILVSSDYDYYLEQTILSAYSVRKYNSDAIIEVLIDQDTAKTITGNRAKLTEFVSRIIEIDVPQHYTMMQRSRFLKTSIPKYVEGDFIYMDSDTIVSGALNNIFDGITNLGLIKDHNTDEYNQNVKSWIKKNCNILGWHDLSQEIAYNGGILVVKRTTKSELFFKHWHANWLECSGKGYDRDQLALTKSNIECNYVIQEISGTYNCQIANYEADVFKPDAKIIHYYDNANCYYIYNDLKLWNKFKQQNAIPDEFVKAVEDPQAVFAHRYVKAYEEDIQLFRSDWYRIYRDYYNLHKYLLKPCLAICKLWIIGSKIKKYFMSH